MYTASLLPMSNNQSQINSGILNSWIKVRTVHRLAWLNPFIDFLLALGKTVLHEQRVGGAEVQQRQHTRAVNFEAASVIRREKANKTVQFLGVKWTYEGDVRRNFCGEDFFLMCSVIFSVCLDFFWLS